MSHHTVTAPAGLATLAVRSLGACFGAFIAVALCAILYLPLADAAVDWRLVLGMVLAAVMIGGYVVATITVKSSADKGHDTEDAPTSFFRGLLIGANAAANFGILWLLLRGVLGDDAALAIGGVIGGIILLATIGPVSRWVGYQAVVGWGNWLMPMSWLIVALGLLFTLFSLLLHLLLALPFKITFLRVGVETGPLAGRSIEFDGATGTVTVFGGLVANLNYLGTAFNMGNFSFVHYKSGEDHIRHEAGHSLNLAAFGSVFHLLGALEENFPVVGTGNRAFSEMLAESHNPNPRGPRLMMWP